MAVGIYKFAVFSFDCKKFNLVNVSINLFLDKATDDLQLLCR